MVLFRHFLGIPVSRLKFHTCETIVVSRHYVRVLAPSTDEFKH